MKTAAMWLGLSSLCLAMLLALTLLIHQRMQTIAMRRGLDQHAAQLVLNRVFVLCEALPFFGDYLKQIFMHLKTLSPRPQRILEALALRYWSISLGLSFVILALCWELLPNWSSKLCAIILWYWSFQQLMGFFLVRQQVWLLKDLIDFVGNIRMHYFDTWMVEESLYYALQGIKNRDRSLVLTQGTQILEMLESPDDENALDNYNLQAPNHYLKLLAAILYLTKEFGDSQPGEASRFAKSLNLLMQELRDEVLWRERLGYALKSLNLVILLPLFALNPIKAWAGNSFEVMKDFYAGPLGYIAENIVCGVVVLSIFLMAQIQWNEGDIAIRYRGNFLGVQRQKREEGGMRSPSKRGAIRISSQQIIVGVTLLCYLIIVGYAQFLGQYLQRAVAISPSAVATSVKPATILTLSADWALIGGCVVCGVAFFSKTLLDRFRRYLKEISAHAEIDRFHTVILAIMHIPQMGVDDIMHWMEKFAIQFKDSLQQALLDYDSGGMKTLQCLYGKTQYIEFQKIISQLMMAAETLTISKAFEELELEKAYYQEKKKLTQERLVQRKINLGQIVGFAPIYATLVVYFMIPMIYASMLEMGRYVEMLK